MEEVAGYLKYMGNKRLKDVFEKHMIRFTQPLELNDPLEFNPILKGYNPEYYSPLLVDGVLMPSSEAWDRELLLEHRVKEYGILSLTKNALSYGMWSRYANGHKGFLIELTPEFNKDPAFQSKTCQFPNVRAVQYVEKCEVDLNLIADDVGFVPFGEFDNIFFKKTKHWQEENEYRLIRMLGELKREDGVPDIYFVDLPIQLIVSVTFGALMSKEDKEYIVKQCGTKIQFFQSVVYRDRSDNQVGLWSLDNEKLLRTILKWKPRRFVMEQDRKDDVLKIISLRNISELPYYSENKKLVENLFLKAKERLSH